MTKTKEVTLYRTTFCNIHVSRVRVLRTVSTGSVPENCLHRLRLCHLRLDTAASSGGGGGYGFTVYTGTVPLGQFVSDVDHHSPAERAGLLTGDRLVEVNGVNVETDSHSQVQAPAAIYAARKITMLHRVLFCSRHDKPQYGTGYPCHGKRSQQFRFFLLNV